MRGDKHRHNPGFRAEVSRRLRAKVKELRKDGLSEAAAARQLGVSPQAFNRYMKGLATPRPDTLARACCIWNMRFSYKDVELSAEAFGAPPSKQDLRRPLQLALFEEPQELNNRNLNVKVSAGKADTLNVAIEIRFAS
jgi:transcriptional regulator with XRE-family HTH domain